MQQPSNSRRQKPRRKQLPNKSVNIHNRRGTTEEFFHILKHRDSEITYFSEKFW